MTAVLPTTLRLGTRRSALAQAQARLVARAVTAATGCAVELVEVTTEADTSSAPLTELGGTGVFVSALREALIAGQVDLAVHSLKDLPVGTADGIVLAAVPERADARDVLVAARGRALAALPAGATVGTGSPRRAVQLRAVRGDLDVVGVRGNVDTRIGQVASGRLDAVVLAYAGLARLGRIDEATEVLGYDVMLPAPGQGALAVECRAGDATVADLLNGLDHPDSRVAVRAERALLAGLEAGCSAPVGALAEIRGTEVVLRAVVGDVNGGLMRVSTSGPVDDPEGLGRRLADRVLAESSEGLLGVRVQ
ncbi:MAG: hydroxymethylbilane synthase [Actinomycetes bacterium]